MSDKMEIQFQNCKRIVIKNLDITFVDGYLVNNQLCRFEKPYSSM